MTLPSTDREGRFRGKTVSFRVSDEEWDEISTLVALSGMTKQEYMTSRALETEVCVRPTIRVQKIMSSELHRIADELGRLSDSSELGLRLLEVSVSIERLLREMHDKGMSAAKGAEELRESETTDLKVLLPPESRQTAISPEQVTPAKRRRKVPRGFFKN